MVLVYSDDKKLTLGAYYIREKNLPKTEHKNVTAVIIGP